MEPKTLGQPFAARMRYTRTWVHDPGHGWRIIAAPPRTTLRTCTEKFRSVLGGMSPAALSPYASSAGMVTPVAFTSRRAARRGGAT